LKTGSHATAQTLETMKELVNDSMADSLIRETATGLLRMFTIRDYYDLVHTFRSWVFGHVTLIGEPEEFLIPPVHAISEINKIGTFYGDCDDASMLLSAMLKVVGIKTRFRAVFQTPDGSYSHVFTEAHLPEIGWLALDATIQGYPAYTGPSLTVEV
jgi:transglutaminase-like putative cysteine protease